MPPSANAFPSEFCSIRRLPHVDESRVVIQNIDPVRRYFSKLLDQPVVIIRMSGFSLGTIFLTIVFEIPKIFFLLAIY